MNNGPPMHSPLGGTPSISNRMNGNPTHPSQQSPHPQMGGMNMPSNLNSNPPMQLGSVSNMMSNNSNSNGNNTPVSMNNNSPNSSVGINSSNPVAGVSGPNMNSIPGSNNNGPNQSSNNTNMNQNQMIGPGHHPGINNSLSMMGPNSSQISGMYGGPKPMPVSAGKVYPADTPMVFNPQNPNAPPIYPCGVCHKEVHDNDQGLLCESGCNFWFHR